MGELIAFADPDEQPGRCGSPRRFSRLARRAQRRGRGNGAAAQSLFHETHSVYAHLVGPETAKAPEGWEERLILIIGPGTEGATGWCLEPHDVVLAKLARGDANDRGFASVALAHGLVDVDTLRARLVQMPLSEHHKSYTARRLLAAIAAAAKLDTPGGKHTVALLTAAQQGPRWVNGAERDGRTVPGHWRPATRTPPAARRDHVRPELPGDRGRDPGTLTLDRHHARAGRTTFFPGEGALAFGTAVGVVEDTPGG